MNPNELLMYAYGSFVLNCILVVAVLMIFIKYPVWTMLKATIRNRPLLAIIRKDRRIDFQVATYKNDSAFIKKYGYFNLTPDAMYSWPGGLRGGFALSGKVTPPPPYLIKAVESLVKEGFENYTEGEVATELTKIMKDKQMVVDDLSEDWLRQNGYSDKFVGYYNTLKTRGLVGQMDDPMNLINFHILETFFKYNLSPSSMYKVIEMEVAKKMEAMGKGFQVTMAHIIMLVVLMIGAALAYVIIKGGGVGAIQGAVGTAASSASSSIQNAAGNSGGVGII
jgi:hypothetical protein